MTWEGAAVCSSSSYFLVDWRRYVAVVLPPEELLPYPFAAAAFGAARIATVQRREKSEKITIRRYLSPVLKKKPT